MTHRVINKLNRTFAYSHFENIQCVSTKPGLIRSLKDYYSKSEKFIKAGYQLGHTMAISFVLPISDNIQGEELNQLKKMAKRFEKKDITQELLPAKQLLKNFWIIKPENENRGRGIELATSFREILTFLTK